MWIHSDDPAPSRPVSVYRGDPLFRLLLDRWRLGSLSIGLLTVCAGFGVLAVWYVALLIWQPQIRPLRGIFEFYSATLGDAILLPVLNVLAVWYCEFVAQGLSLQIARAFPDQPEVERDFVRRCDRAYNHPLVIVSLITITIILTILWHLAEVHGPDRNWTLPVQGKISAAGIYHQAFFGLQMYISLFLTYRHMATVWLILCLARLAPDRAALARFAWELCTFFQVILLGWGAFGSLFLVDFFYNAPIISFGELLSQGVALFLGVYYCASLIGLGILPSLVLFRKLEQRVVERRWLVILGLSCVVLFVGPALRILLTR
ncbi:MAG: hypothetical protein GY832_31790 [Chloroflexi bacterium]|nr:hypothetical protein [Chloroflexota bacterium]